jgi:5-methylcytosine-specific restriction enzyme A
MTWSNNSARRRRLPPNWPALRAQRLKIDNHQCTNNVNGIRCEAPATDVDHINPMTDDHRIEALRSLCRPHHKAKTAAEGVAARATQRARLKLPAEPHPGRR